MEPIPSLIEQKKMVLPFLQRAEEIQAHEPKVAYYCRLYAVDQALQFERRAKEITGLLGAAMATLERDKPRLDLDRDQDKLHCEGFALHIFDNADRVDRAGRADANTAKAFYAASYFLEILNQWGPLDADLAGKQRYAAWRAAEINKAAREGRPPVPPPSDPTLASAGSAGVEGGQQGATSSAGGASTGSDLGMPSLNIAGANTVDGPPDHSHPTPPSISGDHLPSHSSLSWQQSAPPPMAPMSHGAPGSGSAASPLLPGQRYRPGSPVIYCADPPGGLQERGTVGQVFFAPESGFSYRVALRGSLVDAGDEQVCPAPAEGSRVGYLTRAGAEALGAEVVLVNDGVGWPATYMVKLDDGMEVAAEAHQLTFVLPQEAYPQPPQYPQQYQQQQQQQPIAPPPPSLFTAPPSAPSSFSAPPQHSGDSSGSYPRIAGHSSEGAGLPAPQTPPFQPPPHVPPPTQAPPPPTQPLQPPSRPAHAPHPARTPAPSFAAPLPSFSAASSQPPAVGKPSMQVIADAQKNCKYAISSLNFEDVQSAVKYLQTALQLLSMPGGR